MVKSYEKQAKSKADIAKEKSLITKQHIKEKEKATTTSEKKDLDATQKRESTHPIFKKKGKDVEIKQKPKVKIKPKSKDKIAKEKSKEALERKRAGIKVSTPEKHPAHDPDKGGGIHKGKPPKGAQAAELKIAPKKKPISPSDKKKDKAIMKAEEARRKKAKDKAAKKKSDTKRADIRDAAKTKSKETVKSGKSSAAPGGKTYEDRVKALVAKKASLSKKETADGRSEYQVQMNKLKKENKKAWKKMFKGGKLKG